MRHKTGCGIISVGSLARSLRLLPPFRYTFHCGIASASSPTSQPKRRGKSMREWNARSSSDHQANAEDLGTNLRQHGGPHRCVCERVKLGRRLDGGFGKFKKFSGWQAVIFEKLSTDRHGVTGHEAGANRLVDFMARLRLSRLSAARMGAARRVSLCGSTVDSARRARDVAFRNSRRDVWPEWGRLCPGGSVRLGDELHTQEPCLSWLRPMPSGAGPRTASGATCDGSSRKRSATSSPFAGKADAPGTPQGCMTCFGGWCAAGWTRPHAKVARAQSKEGHATSETPPTSTACPHTVSNSLCITYTHRLAQFCRLGQ